MFHYFTNLDIIVDGLKNGKFGPQLDADKESVAAALVGTPGVYGYPTFFDKKTFPGNKTHVQLYIVYCITYYNNPYMLKYFVLILTV